METKETVRKEVTPSVKQKKQNQNQKHSGNSLYDYKELTHPSFAKKENVWIETTRKKLINVFGEKKLADAEFLSKDIKTVYLRQCKTLYKIVNGSTTKYFLNRKASDIDVFDDQAKRKLNTSFKKMGRGAAIKRGLFELLYPEENAQKYIEYRLEKCKKPVIVDEL